MMKSKVERKLHRIGTPSYFACADKVKIPQLGSEDTSTSLDLRIKRFGRAPSAVVLQPSNPKSDPIRNDYLKKISTDITFEEDVVKERCFHMLPYDEKYLFDALSPKGLVLPPPRMKIPPGRHNARHSDVRHMPCNLTATYRPQLKPIKRRIMDKAMQMHKDAIMKAELAEMLNKEKPQLKKEKPQTGGAGVFLTEVEPTKEKGKPESKQSSRKKSVTGDKSKSTVDVKSVSQQEILSQSAPSPTKSEKNKYVDLPEKAILTEKDYNWDGYVLSELSYKTASWLVYERMGASEDQPKMQAMLEGWYGKEDPRNMLKDEYEEVIKSDEEEDKKPKKKWKKKEASVLAKAHLIEDPTPHAHDPYSDNNKAPFYRQPAGLRRIRKIADKEDASAINATADITVKTYTPSPPPTIRDFVNPKVGDKLFDTDNKFEQEWLTGAQQIHQLKGDKLKIELDTDNKYRKRLQEEFPPLPEEWFPETDREKKEAKITPRLKKVTKGLKRWKALPITADDSEDHIVPPGYDAEYHRSPDPMTRRLTKQNQALTQVIDEWRSKWHLMGQLSDSNTEDLIKDMGDIQSHVRLKAIATIAKAAEMQNSYQVDPYSYMAQENQFNFPLATGKMPEKLLVALECLLEDSDQRVAIAAAITLYSLNKPCDQAKHLLHNALQSENVVDRWAAGQCLAHFGTCNSLVVGEIIRQLLTTEDTIKHEKGIFLLGKLSIYSPLVHGMVAEQLNSSSWRHKVIACKVLPTLSGTINKDITNKLTDLMWNDWHEDVRKSAAQCLGKTSHGREVHEELREKLMTGDEMTRLEAINKIGQLGIMTAKLLPIFLKCFSDEYISVRSEVCITCGNLAIQDEQVLEKLVNLSTFDSIWKVKALAIQAMGKIGVITDEIVETLLWAVRYEENPGVRAEACHTLMVLQLKTPEVAEVLQERFLVESSQVVRDEIARTLEMFGISATEDMDMVAQIKNEVRKLCTRNNIASQITLNEKADDKKNNLSRMIYESQEELKTHEQEMTTVEQKTKTGSQVSSRTTSPHPKIVVHVHEGAESPAPNRETAVFTPSADEELDKILAREDAVSSRTSPETTLSEMTSSPTGKSRASSRESESKSKMGRISERDDSESQFSQSMAESEQGIDSEQDKLGDGDTASLRPGSVKFASELQVSDIPGRDRSSMAIMSALDDKGISRLSSIGTGTEVRAFSRDAKLERDKLDREARNGFAGLDARYYEMVEDLIDIDNTYEIITNKGKTLEQVLQEREQIKNITIIRPVESSDLVLPSGADESFPLDDGEGEFPDSEKNDSEPQVKSESSGKVDMFPPKQTSGSVDMFPPKER